jgi:hypothetical protein
MLHASNKIISDTSGKCFLFYPTERAQKCPDMGGDSNDWLLLMLSSTNHREKSLTVFGVVVVPQSQELSRVRSSKIGESEEAGERRALVRRVQMQVTQYSAWTRSELLDFHSTGRNILTSYIHATQ